MQKQIVFISIGKMFFEATAKKSNNFSIKKPKHPGLFFLMEQKYFKR